MVRKWVRFITESGFGKADRESHNSATLIQGGPLMPRFNFGGRPVHEKGETADVLQGLSAFFLQPRRSRTGACAV